MKNRKKRIDLIIELIRNQCIGSREELADILAKKGHRVTQATLSRDLKMPRTTKVPTDRGTYMYVLPDSDSLKDKILSFGHKASSCQLSEWFCVDLFLRQHRCDKTRNGYASGLAYDIDMSHASEILGTIPGQTLYLPCCAKMLRERGQRTFCEDSVNKYHRNLLVMFYMVII